jgi:hypothetical protein
MENSWLREQSVFQILSEVVILPERFYFPALSSRDGGEQS